ncbi:hypothetical protein [Rhizobium phage RHph_X3_2]|nr:hypothetical protein [Rhizobium phage RHph_X3_2]
MNYRCGTCGTADPQQYQRCNHPGCPDGRDQARRVAPLVAEKEDLAELWRLLEVDNQTAAVVRLRGLLERDKQRPAQDAQPAVKETRMPKFNDEYGGEKPNKKFVIGVIAAVVIAVVAIVIYSGAV